MHINLDTMKTGFQNTRKKSERKIFTNNSFDSFSFTSMKKSQFKGIDLSVVNKYKAPIEKFNSNKDFQKWCCEKTNKIKENKFEARSEKTTNVRSEMLKNWYNFVEKDDSKPNNAVAFFVLDGITNNLEEKTEKLPVIFNIDLVKKTLKDISNEVEKNPKQEVNFATKYKESLANYYLEDLENGTGWIVIPSAKKDSANKEKNIEKLITLSSETSWCIKSRFASDYIECSDFHIYFENKKPKICVRLKDDVVHEIQGEKNDRKIPVKYLNIVESYVKDLKLNDNAMYEFEKAENVEAEIKKYENKIYPRTFKDLSTQEILELFDIKTKADEQGYLTISEYSQPSYNFSYEDIGIKENDLFKDIKKIKGTACFIDSNLTDLGVLEEIGGDAYFKDSKISKFDNLKKINRILCSDKSLNKDIIDKINTNT